jgi:predicted RNA-binding protein with PUA-like domain
MPKSYWLIKSEPTKYAYDDLVRDGATRWDGVRNNAAALHLKAMKVGDQALFYHSVEEKQVVGIAEVTRTAYPDPTDEKGRFVAVDVKPVRALPRPVTLADIKASKALSKMEMLRQNRLSVCPVTRAEFDAILKMGGE